MFRIVIAALVPITLFTAIPCRGQTTRGEEVAQEKQEKAVHVRPPVREIGDVVITRLENVFMPAPPAFRLTFGDFRPGAGVALGVTYGVPVGARGLWTSGGAVSIHGFKELETTLDVPPLSTDRVSVRGVGRWEDAPDLRYYGLGMDARPSSQVTYALRSTEAGGEMRVLGRGHFGYGGRLTVMRVASGDGIGDVPSAGTRTSSEWWHSNVYAEFDTRPSPGYATSGGLYRVALHNYAGRSAAPTFRRIAIDARQLVPIRNGNWVLALQGRADLTATCGQQVPFFMLPYLGGRDMLPGFDNYRFTDRNALLTRGELRWMASPVLDMAAFVDAGTVAPEVGALNLHDMARSWGLGARLHGPSYTVLRLEVAHSVEGWRYNIAQGVSF